MEMIRKDSKWERKTSVKKGNLGECLVRAYLEKQGFIVYQPVSDGAHPFDMMAVRDKRLCIAAEVKTKALRTYYSDTGFNKSTYEDYMAFMRKHRMDIFVFFVDEYKKEIYGNWLRELEKPLVVKGPNGQMRDYPRDEDDKRGRKVRYYPFVAMKHVAWLDSKDAEQLKNLSRRNYDYKKM